jgi:hypothetical protein
MLASGATVSVVVSLPVGSPEQPTTRIHGALPASKPRRVCNRIVRGLVVMGMVRVMLLTSISATGAELAGFDDFRTLFDRERERDRGALAGCAVVERHDRYGIEMPFVARVCLVGADFGESPGWWSYTKAMR